MSCTQQPEGCFPPLTRIALFRRHDGKVVETCFQWKVDAPDIPMLELQHRRELAADGLTEVAVFHGRKPHDGRWENGVGTAGCGDVEDGVLTGRNRSRNGHSGTFEFGFGGSQYPSMMMSTSAGTTGLGEDLGGGAITQPRIPANWYSERLSGRGEMAEKMSSGGPPMQTATGIRLPLAAWSAPCL